MAGISTGIPFPYDIITLADLRVLALAYQQETDGQNHYGSAVNRWINEGIRKAWWPCGGVQDEIIFNLSAAKGTNPDGTVGVRDYALPKGFLRERKVTVDGLVLEYRRDSDHDYYSNGTGRPTFYSFWGKPATRIQFGPLAPDSNYSCRIWFFRTPYILKDDTDVYVCPPQWQLTPVKYAAARIMFADGNREDYQALMGEFYQEIGEMAEWYKGESDANFLVVSSSQDY